MPESAGKASALNVIFSFISLLFGVVINVAIARLLGPSEKGALSVFQATQAVLLVTGWSMQQAIIRIVASQRPNWSTLNRALYFLAVVQTILLVAILSLAVLHPPLRRLFLADLPTSSLLVMFVSLWGTLWLYFRNAAILGLQESTLQAKISFLTTIASSFLMVVVLIFLRWHGSLNASSVLIGSVAANLGTGVIIWGLATRRFAVDTSPTSSIWVLLRSLVADAIPLFVRDMLEWANYRVDVFFVNGMLGTRDVGLYTVAVGLSMQVLQIPLAMTGPVFAKMAHLGKSPESLALVQYAYRVTLVISLVVALCVALVVPLLVPLVYSNRYSGSVPMLLWLLPGTVFSGPTRMALAYLRGCGMLAAPIRAEVIGLFLTISLDILLIPRLGPVGASIASSCSYTAVSVYIAHHLVQTSKSSYRDLLLIRREDGQRVMALLLRLLPRSRMADATGS